MHAVAIDSAITALITETRKQYQETDGKSGGHTVSAIGIDVPATGYMVGGYVDSLIFDANLITDGNHDDVVWRMVTKWVNENFTLATKFSMFLGAWIDTETGEAYIDLSQHFAEENRSEAIHTAIFHDELAIWHLTKNEELRTETI